MESKIRKAADKYRKLWGIRCTNSDGFFSWFSITVNHLRQGLIPGGKLDLHAFCEDADKKWCAERVKENKCVHFDLYGTIKIIKQPIEVKGTEPEHSDGSPEVGDNSPRSTT